MECWCDLEAKDQYGYGCIHFAVFSKKTQIVRFPLDNNACANVNAMDIREMTLWHLAALTNGVYAGNELIKQGAKIKKTG